MMRPFIQHVVASIRASAAARWMTVQELRVETRTRLHQRRASRCYARHPRVVPPPGVDDASDSWLEAEVLCVVRRHPEGVRAFDIGNELGIDWRRVPPVTSRLVERAVIEQVDQAFYPVENAS